MAGPRPKPPPIIVGPGQALAPEFAGVGAVCALTVVAMSTPTANPSTAALPRRQILLSVMEMSSFSFDLSLRRQDQEAMPTQIKTCSRTSPQPELPLELITTPRVSDALLHWDSRARPGRRRRVQRPVAIDSTPLHPTGTALPTATKQPASTRGQSSRQPSEPSRPVTGSGGLGAGIR